ncbi:RNA polymerase sigma factor [Novosphingobium sp.]|uniref:RNA polymerase sigma factor n=1 Tax=Novosphingobium sp. TaxID=1874826 RepID=UPI0038BD3B88
MKRLAITCPEDGLGRERADTGPVAPPDPVAAAQLEQIYRAERPSLLRRLARRTGIDQAEDIVQQIFVRLAARAETVDAIGVPARYLGEAARNVQRDEARVAARRSQYQHVSIEDVDIMGGDPISHLEARDRLARLEQGLERLKPLTRNVFLARRLDGYSYAEIAEQTGLSVRGVEKQMSRAIRQLARHLHGT